MRPARRHAVALPVAGFAADAFAQTGGTGGGLESLDLSGLALSLGLIIAVIFAAAWLARRLPGGFRPRGTGPLKLVATLPLGPRERLVLVTSQGREILVGVSPAGVSIAQVTTVPTATADRDADDTAEAARLARSFSSPEGDR